MQRSSSLILTLLSLLAAPSANATILTFDSLTAGYYAPSFNTNGFTFSIASHGFHTGNDSSGWAASGSYNVGVHRNGGSAVPVTMSVTGGGVFSIQSMDLGEFYLRNGARTVSAIGYLSGGGAVNTTFNLDGIADGAGGVADFQTFAFSSAWSNLTSIVFDSPNISTNENSWSFDNVVVNQAVVNTPAPASIALLGLGLLGLGLQRRLSIQR